MCEIDLFASHVNTQIPKFVSWKADPFAFFFSENKKMLPKSLLQRKVWPTFVSKCN